MEQYINSNKDLWNDWASFHPDTPFYKMEEFLNGSSSLMTPEIDALGNLSGKSLLHLQCHFGQDSLSFARLGAQVTGVDFSEKAIQKAKELNQQLELNAHFLQSDVLKLEGKLNQQFDIVFTSYGVLVWLNDLQKWAKTIASHLKPGGQFHIVEFHPFLMTLEFETAKFAYPYFFEEAPIKEIAIGSYANPEEGKQRDEFTWQHSLSEIIMALVDNGLSITDFKEYDYSPYDCFPNMQEVEKGKYQIQNMPSAPHLFSICAVK